MDKKFMPISSIKVGSFIILEGVACRVTDIQTGKTGKHGHAKSRIEAAGIIEGRKKVMIAPTSDKVEVPIIDKKGAQVLSIHDDIANVMDSETFETFDLKIPDDMKNEVKEGMQVIYWIILGEKFLRQSK